MSAESTARPIEPRSALITGAGNGIGRAIALEMARAGYWVVVVDTDRGGASETVEEIRQTYAGRAEQFVANVSSEDDVAAAVDETISEYGRLDVLVNNAGIAGVRASITEYPLEIFDQVIETNVRGVWLGMKYAIPTMREQGSGSIVNVSSTAGMVGSARQCAYVASKHAVVGLTRAAAVELAGSGVRVNAVCPGATATRMILPVLADLAASTGQTTNQVAANMASAEDIASVVAFLASDSAKQIHGAIVPIDAGATAA